MARDKARQLVNELLDDTLETLYYQLTMDTDLDMEDIRELIKEELKVLGYE
jgi:hypothetical protein